MRILFYVLLIAGIGNAVLRPEMENPFTLYRLLAPVCLIVLFALRPMKVMRWLGLFAAFLVYNIILATAYSSDYSQFLPSVVHYLYLFILLGLMLDMKSQHADFDAQYLRFMQWFSIFLFLNLLFEFAIGTTIYPNLYIDETGEASLRAFFWNQNDVAVVLCIIAWFVLTLDRYKGMIRWTIILITVFILYYNDSKAALLSLLFISLPVYSIFRVCRTVSFAPKVWFAFFGTLFALVIVAIASLSEVAIDFANDTYTIGDLLVNPIRRILSLESSGEQWGSLNNRTDAAIFTIIEYLKSFGFGLGAGGSWLVLTQPQYELGGAKSPHNAILQFVVDFGYPVLLGYLAMVYWAFSKLFKRSIKEIDRLKVMAILSFPILGLSQSGAIVTNYFFFASVYFIWMLGHKLGPTQQSRGMCEIGQINPLLVPPTEVQGER